MGKVTITDEAGAAGTPADGVTLYAVGSVLYYIDESGTVHEIVTDNNLPFSGTITAAMLAADSVGSSEIATGAVGADEIAADAVTTVKILNANVTAAKLAADAVETAKIKDANVTDAKLAADIKVGSLAALTTTDKTSVVAALNEIAVTGLSADGVPTPNLVFDPYNLSILPGQRFGGNRQRWADTSNKLVRITDDANNPFGGVTLQLPTDSIYAGKIIFTDEAGILAGDTIYAAATVRGAAGKCRLYLYWSDVLSGGTPTGLSYATVDLNGTVQTIEHSAVVPGTARRIELWVYRSSGSDPIDIYAMWATRNTATDYPAPAAPQALRASNVVWDPINRIVPVNASFGGRARWRNAGADVTLVTADANNPFGEGNTIHLAAARQYFGKIIYPDECGLREGDILTVNALLNGADGSARLYIYYYDALTGGSVVTDGTVFNTATLDGTVKLLGVSSIIPTTARRIELWIYRATGASDIDVYGMWGGPESQNALGYNTDEAVVAELLTARGSEASLDARLTAIEAETSVLSPYPAQSLAYGRHLLRSWYAALGKIRMADTTTQGVIAWIGDSWINSSIRLRNQLNTLLQTAYGNAGAGYCSASTSPTVPTGVVRVQAGTWTQRDRFSTPRAYGPDLFDIIGTDTATPGSVTFTTTATAFVILYLQQADGGEFRYQVDAGAWTVVDTDDTAGLGTATITGLSNASHALKIEVVSAGGAGVCLMGVDCRTDGNGVRVHKLGATGSQAVSWTLHPDPAIFTAAIAALVPNVVAVTLGTNDHSADIVPAAFAASIETLLTTAIGSLDAQALIMAPADNGNTATYVVQDYVNVLRASAVAEGYAMFDALLLLGPYADADARGLYDDASHINEIAGRIICGAALDELLKLD